MSRKEESFTQMSRNYEENGFNILQKINIIETVSNMDPTIKLIFIVYFLCIPVNFIIASYSDGKNALLKYRSSSEYVNNVVNNDAVNKDHIIKYNSNKEWSIVYEECSKNNYNNMISSLIFPYTVFSKIVPSLILALNK